MEVVRNPLRVQNHVTRMVGALVPGVIATTTQACYYGLHPLVASVAQERGLDLEEVWTLIRRVEVALAWVSMHHDQHLVDIPEAHGESEIRSHVAGGSLNLEVASRQGNYAVAKAGFAGGAYFNSEFELGLLERTWTAGPRFDPRGLRVTKARLGPLFELANHDVVAAADVEELAQEICVCTARSGDEGEWLRDLIWGRLGGERWSKPDASRRGSATLLVKAIGAADEPVQSAIDAMRFAVTFDGPLESSIVAHELIDQAGAWRGVFLRHYLVTAWRELWADIVDLCNGLSTGEVREAIASQVDSVNVADFAASFHTIDGDRLLPAEADAWNAFPGVQGNIAVLAIAAQRARELQGSAADVYLGYDESEWGPGWLYRQFESGSDYDLQAWTGNLAQKMLARAQSISLDKFRINEDGRAVVPAQVRERDGSWHRTATAGRGSLSLRLLPLAQVLAGAGILDHADGTWSVSDVGQSLLEQV